MATEDTAGSGSGVAGMVCSLWLLVLGSSVLALEGKEGRQESPISQWGWVWGSGTEKGQGGEDGRHN